MLETQSQVLNSTIVEKVLIENTSRDGRDRVQQALFIKDSELGLTGDCRLSPGRNPPLTYLFLHLPPSPGLLNRASARALLSTKNQASSPS